VIVIHCGAWLTALQEQPNVVVVFTLTEPPPPALVNDWLVGEIEYVHKAVPAYHVPMACQPVDCPRGFSAHMKLYWLPAYAGFNVRAMLTVRFVAELG